MTKEKEQKVETGLSTKDQFKQEDVPALLETMREKLKQLEGDEGDSTSITEPLGPFGRIQDITDPMTLRGAYAYITQKGKVVEEHNSIFKEAVPTIKVGKYKENGNTVDAWQKVILAQYKKTTRKAEIEKIKAFMTELEGLQTEEQKKQTRLSKLKDMMEDFSS